MRNSNFRHALQAQTKETVNQTVNRTVAVALSYDRAKYAPSVAAMGREKLALVMTRAARRYGVPVVYNNKLARKLSHTQPDHFIPEDLYQEVAQLFVDLD